MRTLLTLLSIAVAFLLFGLLDSVRSSFADAGRSDASSTRLRTGARLSFIQPLPLALYERIQHVPGVAGVTFASWFGGSYQDPRNQVFSFAVAPNFLDLYPEVTLGAAEREAFAATRTGILVGQSLALRFNWKVGDRVPLQSAIYPDRQGSRNWTFDVVGILNAKDPASGGFFEQALLMNWKYFDESTPINRGQVGWYIVRVADASQSARTARDIDLLSVSSDHETRTQTEQAAIGSWVRQVADVGLIASATMGAAFFTLLLLSGNTMMQAVRERTRELAVLKTIGFAGPRLMGLVLAESVMLLVLGGATGLVLASGVIGAVDAAAGGMLNLPQLRAGNWGLGLALMIGIGFLVGALPAWHVMRLSIVDALAGR